MSIRECVHVEQLNQPIRKLLFDTSHTRSPEASLGLFSFRLLRRLRFIRSPFWLTSNQSLIEQSISSLFLNAVRRRRCSYTLSQPTYLSIFLKFISTSIKTGTVTELPHSIIFINTLINSIFPLITRSVVQYILLFFRYENLQLYICKFLPVKFIISFF